MHFKIDFLVPEIPFNNELAEFNNLMVNGEFVVFDTETTGLDIDKDDIIQIAAVKLKN